MAATNRLAAETSPYLRQHATNPVDWYPWGEEAKARAAAEDRPILLSVGYSACHWCHVMAHESFENPATAEVMNRLFVNVKVDREERPDVDAVYMDAVQAMTGAGGWPMTVFMTPDGRPFFAGTYFPVRGSGNRPGFVELCHAIDDAWTNRRAELEQQADEVANHLRTRASVVRTSTGAAVLDGRSLAAVAVDRLVTAHDRTWGGFGRAPKFPQASMLELCLRAYAPGGVRAGDRALGAAITLTLDAMVSGGMYDQLGGGFSRYSTDERWLVPHFEKMLYDNAQLVRVYLHAYQLTGLPLYRQVVNETIGYVLRTLRHVDGGFFSAEDADSEGEEGRFYVWDLAEVVEVLGPDLAAEAAAHWGITAHGNWDGRNVLCLPRRGAMARTSELEQARQLLFERRETRVRPGLDDKVITEWSAMMISALSEAGSVLSNPDWVDAAVHGAQFLLAQLRSSEGRWMRAWHPDSANGATIPAYGADHAHLVDAFIRLHEATGEARWIHHAATTADALIHLFADEATGAIRTVGRDGEQLLVDQVDTYDGATPSTNSVAAAALLRLAAFTGSSAYDDAAARILQLISAQMTEQPLGCTNAISAAELLSSGTTEIVIAGPVDDPVSAQLRSVVLNHYRPNSVLAWGEPTDGPLWEGRTHADATRAYVCRNYACERPVTTTDELAAVLDA